MAKKLVRRIGEEILEGLREIRRGEVGRVVTYPPVADTRARVGLSQTEFARFWECLFGRYRSGSKGVAPRPALRACSWPLPTRTRKPSWKPDFKI